MEQIVPQKRRKIGRPPPEEFGFDGFSCRKASFMFSWIASPCSVVYVKMSEIMVMMIMPKTPSHPTACIGGTLYLVISFSSTTIWNATTTCAMTMMRSPTSGLEADADDAFLSRKPERPTKMRPASTRNMPAQWYPFSFLPSHTTLKRPVKITTEPRSIWKLEACVIVRPMYIAVVAHESHMAGIAQTNGLNFCGPISNEDFPPFRVEVKTMILKTRRQANSPTNMVKDWTNG
mmetsp:Transcript_144512/g.204432  ORF Transcript_144512/g.204432 Transcript_144512/m.204432 type:complete len:233 (+) Transcript_144512:509-1207(+)